MNGEECYLDDDGRSPEVQAVEAGDDPQSVSVRVGPVFYPEGRTEETGVWIEYQEHHQAGPVTGPVLLTPEVWRQLVRAVEQRLARKGITPFKCEAVIHTGPGHQSKRECTRADPHPIDGEHYITEVVYEWTGPESFADYWG